MSEWMTELRKLRREMQADFETAWDLQAETNRRLETLAQRLDTLAQLVASQSKELVDLNRTMTGRMRLQEERVGRFFEVVERELDSQDQRLSRLEAAG